MSPSFGVQTLRCDCVFAIGTSDQYGSYKKVEKFDTRELGWSARAPLSTGRQYHAAVAVPVGRECVICVLGGYNCNGYGYLNTCELYSPQEDRWYALPQLKESRQYAAAVALPDGRVFVIGGQNSSGYTLNSVETCHLREPADWQGQRNTSGDFWKNAASMASARSGHAAVAFRGSIFVAGGNTSAVEVFAPPDNQQPLGQWTQLTNGTLKWPNGALVVWEDRLFSFGSIGNPSVSMLEFVPPPTSSTSSRKDYASWICWAGCRKRVKKTGGVEGTGGWHNRTRTWTYHHTPAPQRTLDQELNEQQRNDKDDWTDMHTTFTPGGRANASTAGELPARTGLRGPWFADHGIADTHKPWGPGISSTTTMSVGMRRVWISADLLIAPE
nr:unnamed protein product [Spirometra erinaceieuropaei]